MAKFKFEQKQISILLSYLELNGSIIYGSGLYIVSIQLNQYSKRLRVELMDLDGSQQIIFENINDVFNRSLKLDDKFLLFRSTKYDNTLELIN